MSTTERDRLSTWFDGWAHMLLPEVDFTESRRAVLSWEVDEDEELDAYESPTPQPVYRDANGEYPAGQMPFHAEQSAWSALNLSLQSLGTLVGGHVEAQQHNTYDDGRMQQPTYSMRYEPGTSGWPGEGRL